MEANAADNALEADGIATSLTVGEVQFFLTTAGGSIETSPAGSRKAMPGAGPGQYHRNSGASGLGTRTLSAESEPTAVAMVLKKQLQESMDVARSRHDPQASTRFDAAHARAVAAQRSKLHDLRGAGEIDDDVFHRLEEELDWLELAALPSNEIEVVEG